MSLRESTDTIVANLVQQGSGILLLLAIPNMLPGAQFAAIVTAGVVLSFARFPDLGVSLVYGRDAPRYYGSNDTVMIAAWNRTLLWFSVIAGAAVGVIAGAALFATGAPLEHSVMLALIPPLSAVSSAYVSIAAVQSDFRRYRDANILQSLGRLLAIPLVFLFGVAGWFAAQVIATAMTFAGRGLAWVPRPARIEWRLVSVHLPSAVQLAAITLIWFQVLDSARFFATIHFSAEDIATYGIVVSAYQAAYSVIVSAYLPVSVNTLRLVGKDDGAAVAYVQKVMAQSLPWAFLLAVVAAEVAPGVLQFAFPAYVFNVEATRAMFYGLSAFPIVATVGSLFIGNRRNFLYIAILSAAFVAAYAADSVLYRYVGSGSAALAQVVGTFALAGMYLVAGRVLWPGSYPILWWRPALWLFGLWSAYFMLRHVLLAHIP